MDMGDSPDPNVVPPKGGAHDMVGDRPRDRAQRNCPVRSWRSL